MDGDSEGFDEVLSAVGPRLRALRLQREATLADLSGITGISVSTLSRLESGRRRPTLELLLPLARAHAVPLDELVDAPPTGDPRVRLRAVQRNGMTIIPLSRRPGGVQAWKMVFPAHWPGREPDPQGHEGYEWLYVLAGELRLQLGDSTVALRPGEVAEFDTHVPHAFWNPSARPAEVLSLFGPQGERLHVRARPTGATAPAE